MTKNPFLLKRVESKQIEVSKFKFNPNLESDQDLENKPDLKNELSEDSEDEVIEKLDTPDQLELDASRTTKKPKFELYKRVAIKLTITSKLPLDWLKIDPKTLHLSLNGDKSELPYLLSSHSYIYQCSPQQQATLKQAMTLKKLSDYHRKELEFFKLVELEWKQTLRYLYNNLKNSNFWVLNELFQCKFEQGLVTIFNCTKGLLETLDSQDISFKKVEQVEIRDVHSFYDFLLNWSDSRVDYRVKQLPILLSMTSFPNGRLKICDIFNAVKVKKLDGTVFYKSEIQGLVFDENVRQLVELLQDGACEVVVELYGK